MNLMRLRSAKPPLLIMNEQAWDDMRDDLFALLPNDQALAVLKIFKKHAKEQSRLQLKTKMEAVISKVREYTDLSKPSGLPSNGCLIGLDKQSAFSLLNHVDSSE